MQTPKEFYSHNHEISREFELLKKRHFCTKNFWLFSTLPKPQEKTHENKSSPFVWSDHFSWSKWARVLIVSEKAPVFPRTAISVKTLSKSSLIIIKVYLRLKCLKANNNSKIFRYYSKIAWNYFILIWRMVLIIGLSIWYVLYDKLVYIENELSHYEVINYLVIS